MLNSYAQKILILDFGSQYTQLIARSIRDLGVYCEIYPFDIDEEIINEFAPKGIILSGGPQTVTQDFTPRAPQIVFQLGCPVLGICYGMQTMAAQLGGQVASVNKREFGHTQIEITRKSRIFDGIDDAVIEGKSFLDVWMSHGDQVVEIPAGFEVIASSKNAPIAAFADGKNNFYAIQFHPEVTHTKQGLRILARFIYGICGCEKQWTPTNIIEELVVKIRQQAGDDRVVLGLSGGVDSAVVALLLNKAIGEKLTCIFVDTGLLRLNEARQVMQTYKQHFHLDVRCIDAKKQFISALTGVSDPEKKRKIIGNEFVNVFEAEAKKLANVVWLAQGTIYPDVIESAKTKFSKAEVIKSHHNVGGLPEKMNLKILEPVRELFKDEVRKIGLELGMPYDLVYRHPFPGPGLGVRVLGEIKQEYVEKLQLADNIFIEELRENNLYGKISQAFAVFLPVKSVGVMGDARKYEWVIALRAVETSDFMTASWSYLPHEFLSNVSNRIVNEIPGISRVVYDISGKPPSTIEWE